MTRCEYVHACLYMYIITCVLFVVFMPCTAPDPLGSTSFCLTSRLGTDCFFQALRLAIEMSRPILRPSAQYTATVH